MKNIKIILFTVTVANKYVLMKDIINHTKLTLVKILFTGFLVI